jgi:hypothetical protein
MDCSVLGREDTSIESVMFSLIELGHLSVCILGLASYITLCLIENLNQYLFSATNA